MAQEGSEASVASTSPNPNWLDMHANPLSSWNHLNTWQQPLQQQQKPNSGSCEEDISISATSFTNASNHSGLSVDSSEPVENHLWSQVFLSIGNATGNSHSSHVDGENFLEATLQPATKHRSTEMTFQPACDYLKKLESGWEFTSPTASFNSTDQKQLDSAKMVEHGQPTADLVSNWSLAPPHPKFGYDHNHQVSSSAGGLLEPNFPPDQLYSAYSGFMPCYEHDAKGEIPQQQIGAQQLSFLRPLASDASTGYQFGLRNSFLGINHSKYGCDTRSTFTDLISFGGNMNKSLVPPKDLPAECKKQVDEAPSSTKGILKKVGASASESKKKRSDESSDFALMKKSKHESSNPSSAKLQVTKVKLGDKITALQQIVSPFGKTDTASVLQEAINYVRFLHEQVQLLSDPYMNSGVNKDHRSWGGLDRKEEQEAKPDLCSRGLCLFPISCTPPSYRENTGPDYWTPTYRGCLYR